MSKIEIFDNSLFVIKISGKISMDYNLLYHNLQKISELVSNINNLKIILIIGFGKPVDDLLYKLYNKKSIKIDGKRVTEKEEIEVIKMISGLNVINVSSILVKFNILHYLMPIIHPDYVKCNKRPVGKYDFKYVGDINYINSNMMLDLLINRDILVASSMLLDQDTNEPLNINADSLATEIAIKMNARRLIFISDVDGVYDKNQNILKSIGVNEIDELITNGTAKDGMSVKLKNIKYALESGLNSVQIVSGNSSDIFGLDKNNGTLFVNTK